MGLGGWRITPLEARSATFNSFCLRDNLPTPDPDSPPSVPSELVPFSPTAGTVENRRGPTRKEKLIYKNPEYVVNFSSSPVGHITPDPYTEPDFKHRWVQGHLCRRDRTVPSLRSTFVTRSQSAGYYPREQYVEEETSMWGWLR